MKKQVENVAVMVATAFLLWGLHVGVFNGGVAAQQIVGGGYAYAYQAIAPTSAAAIGLTAATVAAGSGAKQMYCTVETASVRYRWDAGGTPTTSEGHLVAAGGSITLGETNSITNFKVIAVSTTAAVKCTLSR